MYVYKYLKEPHITFFGTMRHFSYEKVSKIMRFLSLRYSADFVRSRLVLKQHCHMSGSSTGACCWKYSMQMNLIGPETLKSSLLLSV